MWTVDPKIPMSLWWAMAIAGLAAIVWYGLRREWPIARRRWLLIGLPMIGVAGPLLIALNPTWVEIIPPLPGNPLLTVLVDGTMSMRTEDVGRDASSSRWQKAIEIAQQVKSNGTTVEVRKLAFGELVKPLNPSPSDSEDTWPQGHRSDLGAALRQATRTGSPLGHAILMISDGAHNAGTVESLLQSAREANALATPVYTVTLGTSVGLKNMGLTAKTPRMIAFPDTPIVVRASVGHNGLAGQSTQVHLLQDNTVLQSKPVKLGSEPTQEVKFEIPAGFKQSIERFRLVADEVAGEVTVADNQTTVLVQRLNSPIGVLVLEGKPYWDSKFLARNLARDPVVNLTSIVRMGSDRYLQRRVAAESEEVVDVPAVPSVSPSDESESTVSSMPKKSDWTIEKELSSPLESMELLEQYRLVIVGRDAGAFLTDKGIDNLRQWIAQSGGCLVCSRGAPTDQVSTKLAEILPVRWVPGNEARLRASVTQYGIDSSMFDPLLATGDDPLGALPSLAIGATPSQRPGLPQVLMQSVVDESGKPIPIVTYQPFGSGQSIVVEGAGMWRWAFLPPEHAAKDKIYATLWQSMIQWIISQQDIMPGQDVAIRSDRATFLSGDRVSASVTVRDPAKWSLENGASSVSVILQAADAELPKRVSLSASGVENGLFRADFGQLAVGYYTIKAVAGIQDQVLAASALEVRDPWFESLEVDARPDIMRQVAKLSGGEALEPDAVSKLVERFEEAVRKQQKREEIRTTMWDRPAVLLVILICWMSAWIIRRQSGLI